jgi:hypothetical protein
LSADLLKRLADAGTPMDLIMEVAETLAEARAAERLLDRRREKDRIRKRNSKDSAESVETAESVEIQHGVSLDKETSPRPPKEINPIPCERVSRAWALPVGVSLATWTDFLTNRKRKRLVNTPSTWKTFNDDLARVSGETGIPPPKLIELCTGKGWGGIYDPREDGNGQSAQRVNGMGRNQPGDGLSATTRAARDVFGVGASH